MTEAQAYVDFDDYLPCRLAAASTTVLRSVASIFADSYDMSIPEWKVLSAIARHPKLSAVEVAQTTDLDTVAVSRAVTKLMDAGRVCREFGKEDRRRSMLELSEEGRKLYEQITPMAARLEARLLEELSDDEIRILERALKSLSARSKAFATAFEPRKKRIAIRKDDGYRLIAQRPLVNGTISGGRSNAENRQRPVRVSASEAVAFFVSGQRKVSIAANSKP
jgi:DNA-binding MarR family transcriptional regulator